MLQINNETAHKMFFQIMERFDRIDRALERMNKLKDCLDGDTLLDNYDLCQLLGITKRTLARYRQKKLVTYYMIDGRTYYKASEVEPSSIRKEVIAGKIQGASECLTKTGYGLWRLYVSTDRLFEELRVRFCEFEERLTRVCRPVEDLGLKNWLDNQEVCEVLRISKKTLQVYRAKGILLSAVSRTSSSTSRKIYRDYWN